MWCWYWRVLTVADDAWEEVLLTSVRVMPIQNPLANAFMTICHDSLPAPRPVRGASRTRL